MDPIVEHLRQANYTNRIFNERQLADALGGSDARRYGLVNRALKSGALQRLKRGLYILPSQYRSTPVHPFTVAQALVPGSYISFESALSFHGWIPEATYTVASVTPGRKTLEYDIRTTGYFTFSPVATNRYTFLTGVERLILGGAVAFVASPLRALLDLVATRKASWQGLAWLTQGLRIDAELLMNLDPATFVALRSVYKHKAAKAFLDALENAIALSAQLPRGDFQND